MTSFLGCFVSTKYVLLYDGIKYRGCYLKIYINDVMSEDVMAKFMSKISKLIKLKLQVINDMVELSSVIHIRT